MQGIPFHKLIVLCTSLQHPCFVLTPVLLLRVVGVYCFVGLAAQSTSFYASQVVQAFACEPLPTKLQTSLPASHWSRPM